MMNIQTEILKELIVSLVNRINDKKILRLIYNDKRNDGSRNG